MRCGWRLELAATITPPRLQLIYTKEALAREIGVPAELIARRAFAETQANLYSVSVHKKRSGGTRIIHAPYWPLANIQGKLLPLLEQIYRPSPRVMGFVKGRGIKQNAKFHVGKRLILNIDIKDYFHSIHIGRVRGRLIAPPYSLTNDVATTIAKLCTLDGVLPIGASTSPILANMITSSLDEYLTNIARQNGCFYTRYADDITFSTNRRSFPSCMVLNAGHSSAEIQLGTELLEAFSKGGFEIQPSKTRLLTKTMRQEVCGVTCNVHLNPRRELLREVRAITHAWKKFGRSAAEIVWRKKYNWRGAQSLESSLRGKIEYIKHIRGDNDISTATIVSRFNDLLDREYRDIEYVYEGNKREMITRSICLVESGNNETMDWKQGSGFVAASGIVVTNFHNVSINKQLAPSIEVIFPAQNGLRHEMVVTFSDADRDIAVLRPKDPNWLPYFENLACDLSFTEAEQGTHVYVGGFPSYNVGDSCTVAAGEVVGTSVSDGQRFFRISQMIVKGNSGGPVFDDLGQVVGIATRGVDTHDVANVAFNGCIPLHTVDRIFLTG